MRTLILSAPAALALGAAAGTFGGSPVQTNDVIVGLSFSDPLDTIEMARGPREENGGVQVDDWFEVAWMQSVEFDNLGGVLHNPQGNLLGLNFGTFDTGGSIYSMATCSMVPDNQLIGDTLGLGGDGVSVSRLGGLSVSPENTKIAMVAYDTGQVVVFDYSEGDCEGTGAALSGARETTGVPMFLADTQGTAWLDDDTVLAFATTGDIWTINADTMEMTNEQFVDTIDGGGPGFSDIEYNPEISSFIYCMYSAFTGVTRNLLFVLDTDFDLIVTVDYSKSMNTSREIAFDADGNLMVGQFSNTIDIIENAADPASLRDNLSSDWYIGQFASFPGMDVALGEGGGQPCPADFDDSGDVGFSDLVALLANWGPCKDPEDCPWDLDGSTEVDFNDLVAVLAAWGPCP